MGINANIGYIIKTKNFTYQKTKDNISNGATLSYFAKRNDGKEIFVKIYDNPKKITIEEYAKYQNRVLEYLTKLPPSYVEVTYEVLLDNENKQYLQFKKMEKGAVNLMDFLKGESRDIFPKFKDIGMRGNIAKVISGIVKEVHKAGIIHTDLKPEQFLIKKSSNKFGFEMKLIDFDNCVIKSEKLTGLKVKSDGWYPPERIDDTIWKPDYSTDVFTMGLIIYMLFADHPYVTVTEDVKKYEECIKTKKGYVSLYDRFKAEEIKPLSDMIDRMLDPDPKKRPSMQEVYSVIID